MATPPCVVFADQVRRTPRLGPAHIREVGGSIGRRAVLEDFAKRGGAARQRRAPGAPARPVVILSRSEGSRRRWTERTRCFDFAQHDGGCASVKDRAVWVCPAR